MELKNAFTLLYVVVLSSYFEPLFSCDLQRLFTESVLAKHVILIVSCFFLLTLMEDDKKPRSLGETFKLTGALYALYIASVKSKAIFVMPMILALVADHVLRVQVELMEKREADGLASDGDLALKARLVQLRAALTWVIVALIVGGMLHYYIRARLEFGDQFSTVAFFAGTKKCAHGPA